MVRRSKRKRTEWLFAVLRKRKWFLLVLALLFLMWLGYNHAIARWADHSAKLLQLEEKLSTIDFNHDPAKYMASQRALEIERAEPFYIGLLILIPASFTIVLIVCIWKYLGRSNSEINPRSMDDHRAIRRTRLARQQSATHSDERGSKRS